MPEWAELSDRLLPPPPWYAPWHAYVGAPEVRVEAQLKILNLTRGDLRTGVQGTPGYSESHSGSMYRYHRSTSTSAARRSMVHSRYRNRWWRVANSSVATVTTGDGTTLSRSGRQNAYNKTCDRSSIASSQALYSYS